MIQTEITRIASRRFATKAAASGELHEFHFTGKFSGRRDRRRRRPAISVDRFRWDRRCRAYAERIRRRNSVGGRNCDSRRKSCVKHASGGQRSVPISRRRFNYARQNDASRRPICIYSGPPGRSLFFANRNSIKRLAVLPRAWPVLLRQSRRHGLLYDGRPEPDNPKQGICQ